MKKQVMKKQIRKCLTKAIMLLCALLFTANLFAQNKVIVNGTITDTTGETVIGASITEKGIPSNGTITNIDGNFSLSVNPDATLIISFIGYITQEVKASKDMKIVLSEDTKILDEVVVVGYGTMRKKDLTGSIAQIRPDKIANENPTTVQDILRGIPGLAVGYDATAKGGGSLQIRGQRSVYTDGGHNDPLIILDGMIFYGELSEVNPDDIGQIDILKDASSAAIYGARAANGVIIVTTKKGKIGKPVINVTTNIGLSTLSDYREVYSPEGYLQYREDWYKAPTYGMNLQTGVYEAYQTREGSVTPEMKGYYDRPENLSKYGVSLDAWRAYTTNETGDSDQAIWAKRLMINGSLLENYLAGKTYNWWDHSFRTGLNQDYNASISGASERMNYYLSVGYLENEGAVKGNEYSAMRANMKLDGKITNWLEVGANVNFQDRSDGDVAVGLGTNDWDENQARNSPFASYLDEDGQPKRWPMDNQNSNHGYNYDFKRQFIELEKGYTTLNTILTAKITLPFNITYSFNASPRYQFFYDRYFESTKNPDWSAATHGANREQAKRFDWSLDNTINWDKTFVDKHHVTLTLVQEAEERRYWQDRIEARNILPSDVLGFHNTKNGGKAESTFSTNDTHQTADALLARLFYSYDNRYMITASVRRDGYSAFGSSNPYATFPSVALAWSFKDENFFKWEPLSTGKLRISYGKNGNRSLNDPYVSLANLGTGSGKTQGYVNSSGDTEQVRYLSVDRLANPNLQWEKTTAWNFGIDYGFLRDRITGSVEYYNMSTTDMIMNQRLPGFSGFSSIATNLGQVDNRGIEISINSTNIKNDVLEWNTTFGFSYNKNEIKHLYYEDEDVLDEAGNVIGTKEMDDKDNNWFIGQPISVIWNYRVSGIWQANEAEEAARYGQRPGDPKVANNYTADDVKNADGSITPVYNNNDKEFLGQTTAPVMWSMRNEFIFWKNLSFSFNLYSYMGHKSSSAYYLNQDNSQSLVTYAFNMYEKKYWTPENPSNDYARLNAKIPSGASANKVYDRSFIRLENISLAYTFPRTLTSRMNIDKVKVFGTVRNVAYWAKDWEYGDPEASSGINGQSHHRPAFRIFTLGLNLTF
ncbi:MAG: SusC/RagA family TonB-linked outer membrane protein [Dysgonamonadaceae bacterium]|jgi:TonB-linked SusC/RagA family outer membrane protein|nr:SusC/RagA family TonB-linked outer membrane protein [Dysgonamonadaceae bacterium]